MKLNLKFMVSKLHKKNSLFYTKELLDIEIIIFIRVLILYFLLPKTDKNYFFSEIKNCYINTLYKYFQNTLKHVLINDIKGRLVY